MAVFGYTRVSTADQALGTSLEEQERRIHGVAMMRGVELTQLFTEAGISGSVPLEGRPAGRVLLAALRPGDTLIVSKLDRAFRNAADALTRADAWRRAGVHLIVADMGADPVTGKGVAKMFFGMLALVAEFERDRILERTHEGRRTKAARGGHIGGSAPFGYRVAGSGREARLVEVPEQQSAIKMIRSMRGRASLRQIAEQVRRTHGVRISHEGVRQVLATPTLHRLRRDLAVS
jgi:DNA invertase Pin-like site-specific DNA recombinase